jgi:thymidylate synthase (FAD)
MKIVPNAVLEKIVVPADDVGMFRFAERAGRLCWRSQHNITDGSYVKFLSGILEKGHGMVLEFTNVVYHVYDNSQRMLSDMRGRESARYLSLYEGDISNGLHRTLIGGSVRAWVDFMSDVMRMDLSNCVIAAINSEGKGLDSLIHRIWPELKFTRMTSLGDIPLPLLKYAVLFQTDRAVTHEIVRHRTLSHLQESQRYITQAGGVEFTHQWWWDSPLIGKRHDLCSSCADWVIASLSETEKLYHRLLQEVSPEKARGVLPQVTTARIFSCGSLAHWKHLLGLRTSSRAYAQFRLLAAEVAHDFHARGWGGYLPASWIPDVAEMQ